MSRKHRYSWLTLGAVLLLLGAGLVFLAIAGPLPVNAALRSAIPDSWRRDAPIIARRIDAPSGHLALEPQLQVKATPAAGVVQPESSESCVSCHTSKALLQKLMPDVEASVALTGTQATAYTRTMPIWEKVLVDEAFLDDVHGKPGCVGCHGGTPNTVDFVDAHSGLRSPDRRPEVVCGSCHVGVAKQGRTSLHHLQWGIQQALIERGADLTDPAMAKAYDKQCTACHATCGDCHVSRTREAGGGLAGGHDFSATGFDHNACTTCHGATVGAESTGIQGSEGDFHAALGMSCTSCHATTATYHSGSPGVGMYDGRPEPACTDCHPEAAKRGGDNLQHTIHSQTVQCQVCHASGPYTSFDDYAALGSTETISDTLAFKIGRNPTPSDQRPWTYVLLREVPFTAETFAKSGSDLLPGIDEVPSWMLATPHNMQRVTPQNQSCNACHGQESLFLTEDDLPAGAVEANRSVIVPKIPATRLEVPQ